MSDNPYAAPKVDPANPFSSASKEALRRAHLSHEVSIKSLGFLFYLAAAFLLLSNFGEADDFQREHGPVVQYSITIFLTLVFLALGLGIRRFKKWARIGVFLFSLVGLLGFPVGTIISPFILYLILGRKGKIVFSAAYQEAIAATPDLKYQSSKWVWILFITLVIVIGSAYVLHLITQWQT